MHNLGDTAKTIEQAVLWNWKWRQSSDGADTRGEWLKIEYLEFLVAIMK